MPKLRHGTNDIESFVQWIARKCRNHNPLEELKVEPTQRAKLGNQHSVLEYGEPRLRANDRCKIVYGEAGRFFEISVRELDEEEVADAQLVSVGY